MRLLLLLFIATAAVQAQTSHGYALIGPVFPSSNFFTRYQNTQLHVAAGGELHTGRIFALNGELGGLFPVNNRFGVNSMIGGGGASIHLLGGATRRVDPFVHGGVGMIANTGAGMLVYVGGGVNVWLKPRLGVRVDVRDWIPVTFDDRLHLVAVRFGIAFR